MYRVVNVVQIPDPVLVVVVYAKEVAFNKLKIVYKKNNRWLINLNQGEFALIIIMNAVMSAMNVATSIFRAANAVDRGVAKIDHLV